MKTRIRRGIVKVWKIVCGGNEAHFELKLGV